MRFETRSANRCQISKLGFGSSRASPEKRWSAQFPFGFTDLTEQIQKSKYFCGLFQWLADHQSDAWAMTNISPYGKMHLGDMFFGCYMRTQVEVRQFIERRPRAKSPYRMRFMMLSQDALGELQERLADKSLGMQAVRVLVAMMQSLDWENRVEEPQKAIAARLGMSPQEVYKASKALVDCGFIQRMVDRRGWYRVSPTLCWKGSAKNLEKELAA